MHFRHFVLKNQLLTLYLWNKLVRTNLFYEDMLHSKCFYGNPQNGTLATEKLQEMSLDQENCVLDTFRTSTVPLLEYWNEKHHLALFKDLESLPLNLSREKWQSMTKVFEFSVPPLEGQGKPSVTDLMLSSEEIQIAIEAEFTEMFDTDYQTVSQWLEEGSYANRLAILDGWCDLLNPYLDTTITANSSFIEDMPYQLLHRAASACMDKPERAVLWYQLFREEGVLSHEDVRAFEHKVVRCVENLHFSKQFTVLITLNTVKYATDIVSNFTEVDGSAKLNQLFGRMLSAYPIITDFGDIEVLYFD